MTDTKKELGQHWLHDEQILQAIASAADASKGDYVLEIGPGTGTLTAVLAATGSTVLALEYDAELIKNLQRLFAGTDTVTVRQGDVRTFDYSALPVGYKVVANIPYYLTSHLIRSLSEASNPPVSAVLLIQKEVAERIAARPGQMSILSVTAQFYFECALDIEVPAEYFSPPPKVDSQVIVLKRRQGQLFDVDMRTFFSLVKAGFSERRKTLRNSLSGGLHITKDQAQDHIYAAGLKPTARAQELSLEDWYTLYKEVYA